MTAYSENGPVAYRILPINGLQNGYRHVILRSLENQNLGPITLFVYFDIFFHVDRMHEDHHSAYLDPFLEAKKEKALGESLAHPFRKQEKNIVDNSYRQAIIGTKGLSRGETTLDSEEESDELPPPTSSTSSSLITQASRKLGQFRRRIHMASQNIRSKLK
ncbi:hypothetical protein OESDEN_05213 [Oesophagostomum dentatum]|uniref:Uncharacterized protein n=1 Tax=Oesophagostomum dentatum TaxID=61180 RepID=A0A0B1TBA8_OESDE|nr:hypothetical protein OESDEN_05213 [Oesophagostomum dentatum]